MSLGASRQRSLDMMEKMLEASEPQMTAMFAIFTRLTAGEEPLGAEHPPPRGVLRRHPRIFLLLPMAAILVLLAGVVIGLTAAGASACGAARSPARVTRSVASCRAPVTPWHGRQVIGLKAASAGGS